MDKTLQRRVTVFLAVLLSFAIGGTSLLGLLQQQVSTSQTAPQPTDPPVPTVPPPVQNLDGVMFDRTYLHPSGLFTAALPTGFVPQNQFSTTGEAQVTMENSDQLSVIEMRILRPTAEQSIATADDLNGIFNDAWLRQSWREYNSWDVDTRRVDDDRLIMDFSLTQGGQNYIARQIAFADETWVYTVRVVTPANASEYLRYVLENEVESFQPIERYVGTRLEWDGYYDNVTEHLIRYPGTWNLADSAPGAPASIVAEGVELRVETTDSVIDSEEAAEDFVAGLRSGAQVESVTAIEQYGTSGYSVAYLLPSLDGGSQSGLVYLLQGDERTHVANLLLSDVGAVDLNAEEVAESYAGTLGALETFSLFPDLDAQFVGDRDISGSDS